MKILVIRFNAMGSVVVTSVLCSTLKKSFPNAKVDYLMHESIAPLFRDDPNINEVLTLKTSSGFIKKHNWLKKVISISRNQYDIVIDASSTSKSKIISLFSRNAQFRIGRKKKRSSIFYTHEISSNTVLDKVKERLSMLNPLIDSGMNIEFIETMKLYIPDDECQEVQEKMISAGVDFNRPIFAFNISSKCSGKKWRFEYMQELIQYCLDKYQAQIIFCAGLEHEKKDAIYLHEQLAGHKDVFSNINILNLRNLAATMKNCDVFIGNEGGPRHIAHAMGLPTVSIFSPAANRHVWLPEEGKRHRGIQWQDIEQDIDLEKSNSESEDSRYFRRYNSIKPEGVIPLVDDVIASNNITTKNND